MLAIISVACAGVTKASARITVACTSSANVSKNSAGFAASAGVAANNVSNSVFIVILSRCRFWGRTVFDSISFKICCGAALVAWFAGRSWQHHKRLHLLVGFTPCVWQPFKKFWPPHTPLGFHERIGGGHPARAGLVSLPARVVSRN